MVAACEDAVHVFDCASGAEVQLLQYGPGMRPAPGGAAGAGCIMHFAYLCFHLRRGVGLHAWMPTCQGSDVELVLGREAWRMRPGGPEATPQLASLLRGAGQLMFAASSAPGTAPPAGGSTADGCVVLAGRSVAWACLPVSPEEQAAELLGRREYGDAMALIEGGLRQGARWAAVASAQAALCMLHGAQGRGWVGGAEGRDEGKPVPGLVPVLPLLGQQCLGEE